MNKTQPALTGIWKAYAVWRYRIGLGPGTYLFRFLILSLLVIFFGVPVLWLFITPTKKHIELTELSPLALPPLPFT